MRQAAANIFIIFAEKSLPAAQSLIEALSYNDKDTRVWYVLALSSIGKSVVPQIITALNIFLQRIKLNLKGKSSEIYRI